MNVFAPVKLGKRQVVTVSTGTQNNGIKYRTEVSLLVEPCSIHEGNITIDMCEYNTDGLNTAGIDRGFISVPKGSLMHFGIVTMCNLGNKELKSHCTDLGIAPRLDRSLTTLVNKYIA